MSLCNIPFMRFSLRECSVCATRPSPPASGRRGAPAHGLTVQKSARPPRRCLHLPLNHCTHQGTSLPSLIAHKWLLLELVVEQPVEQPAGMLRQQRWQEPLESGWGALLLRHTKCPLAWDPRSGLGLPLIRAVCCQVSIRWPVVQWVLAQGLRKINQRILPNSGESLTTIFGEATAPSLGPLAQKPTEKPCPPKMSPKCV